MSSAFYCLTKITLSQDKILFVCMTCLYMTGIPPLPVLLVPSLWIFLFWTSFLSIFDSLNKLWYSQFLFDGTGTIYPHYWNWHLKSFWEWLFPSDPFYVYPFPFGVVWSLSPCVAFHFLVFSFCCPYFSMWGWWPEGNLSDTYPHQKCPWIPYSLTHHLVLVGLGELFCVPYTSFTWFYGAHNPSCLIQACYVVVGRGMESLPFDPSSCPGPYFFVVYQLIFPSGLSFLWSLFPFLSLCIECSYLLLNLYLFLLSLPCLYWDIIYLL